MRPIALVLMVVLACTILCSFVSDGLALDDRTIRADSTMDGHAGFILRFIEQGSAGSEAFVYEEAGFYRVYAIREDGGSWDLMAPGQYFSPVSSMTIGQTWRWLDTDLAEETTAEVVAMEQVTVTAGTFSCYRIDITTASLPYVIESIWLSEGVGQVKEESFNGDGYSHGQLESYSVTGTGFFPSDVGNTWIYTDSFVSVRETTWGSLKTLYR